MPVDWFEQNRDRLRAEGISEEDARDFVSRNPGHEGQGGDYHRVFDALGGQGEDRSSAQAPSGGYDLRGVPTPNLPQYEKPPAFNYDPYSSGLSLPTFSKAAPYTPQLNLPTFKAGAAYTPGPALEPWKAPSIDEVMADPSYQWRKSQGEDSLQRWAAAKGTLNDSGTATALMDYGQGAASQEYGAVWNRNRGAYEMNRDTSAMNEAQRLGAYTTNYQTQTIDPYRFEYQRGLDEEMSRASAYNTNYQTQNIDPYRFDYQRAMDTEDRRFGTYMANRAGALTQYNTNYGTQYVDPYKFEYQRQSDLFAPQMAEWQTEADFRNLRYSTDAAGKLQSQQLSVTDAWNRFLANQNQGNWEKDFEFKVAGGND